VAAIKGERAGGRHQGSGADGNAIETDCKLSVGRPALERAPCRAGLIARRLGYRRMQEARHPHPLPLPLICGVRNAMYMRTPFHISERAQRITLRRPAVLLLRHLIFLLFFRQQLLLEPDLRGPHDLRGLRMASCAAFMLLKASSQLNLGKTLRGTCRGSTKCRSIRKLPRSSATMAARSRSSMSSRTAAERESSIATASAAAAREDASILLGRGGARTQS